MAKTVTGKNPKCTCGAPLPQHLADLWMKEDRKRFSHVCSCYMGWSYDAKAKTWTETGNKPNPFADYDNAQATRKMKKAKVVS